MSMTLSLPTVADLLGAHRSTLNDRFNRGEFTVEVNGQPHELRAIRIGRCWKVARSSVEAIVGPIGAAA